MEACGVILPSFNTNKGHLKVAALSAQRIANMAPPAGWCGGNDAQAGFPLVIFTDLDGRSCHTVVNETLNAQPPAFRITFIWDALAHPLLAELHKMLRLSTYRYSWKLWKPLALLASPFETTLMLDADATPCSATSLASLFHGFAHLRPPPVLAAAQYWLSKSIFARDIVVPKETNETEKKMLWEETRASLWTTALGKHVPLPLAAPFTLLWGHEVSPFSRCPHTYYDYERAVSLNSGVIIANKGRAEPILVTWANLLAQAVADCPDHVIGADQTLFSLALVSAGEATPIAALSPFTVCRYTGSWGIRKCHNASGRDDTNSDRRCLIEHTRDQRRLQEIMYADRNASSAGVRHRDFTYQNLTWDRLPDVKRLENWVKSVDQKIGHSLLCMAAAHSFLKDEPLCRMGMQWLQGLAAKAAADAHASGLRWSDAIPDKSFRSLINNRSRFLRNFDLR
mmetsp:Transcript_37693/g.62394  ORF Transcript_37693/g.62394 Transcript_37693/m.62394 type:complete len:454 (+) Transcript_37693:247-1608(+)|eukprot:CAMPEP_0119310196 /NCGR_PEP_ID=MMETSP1333-20130426/17998_1 /TAXON_ID=418940 /ORGANISM="Scyphosphaera apsteinii, Strain RCC1455" /LENGTH=453 /DNA_ID=CAMNT_0007314333 /DNA_START=243 /DNA_END=1604 /DNA_ORIENTATION=-